MKTAVLRKWAHCDYCFSIFFVIHEPKHYKRTLLSPENFPITKFNATHSQLNYLPQRIVKWNTRKQHQNTQFFFHNTLMTMKLNYFKNYIN